MESTSFGTFLPPKDLDPTSDRAPVVPPSPSPSPLNCPGSSLNDHSGPPHTEIDDSTRIALCYTGQERVKQKMTRGVFEVCLE